MEFYFSTSTRILRQRRRPASSLLRVLTEARGRSSEISSAEGASEKFNFLTYIVNM